MKSQRIQNRNSIITILISISFITACPLNKGDSITDTRINNAVKTELLENEAVPSHLIDVSTIDGVVTLSGSVSNLLARDQALRVVESIKGVRSIVNRIDIKPVKRSDGQIKKDIKRALLEDPVTESYKIDVKVNDGVAELSGSVASWAERDICLRVAKGVKGIKEIKNDISIKFKNARPDDEIKAEIERRIKADPYLDHEFIHVDVANGIVHLRGSVGSPAEMRRAKINSHVSGVESVDRSELEVRNWIEEPMERNNVWVDRSGEEIIKAVKDALLYDPRTSSFDISVRINADVVVLTGTVNNLESKLAAEKDAINTVGVRRVRNLIEVRPDEEINDTIIADRVRSALLIDPVIERYDVTVSTRNGKVFLYGTVDTEYEREHAGDIASGIKGAIEVRNNIDVSPGIYKKNDALLKENIEDQLFWSIFVDSNEIDVSVEDGTAVLTGDVDSWSEMYSAIENAFEGGAESVISRLSLNGEDYFYPEYERHDFYKWRLF